MIQLIRAAFHTGSGSVMGLITGNICPVHADACSVLTPVTREKSWEPFEGLGACRTDAMSGRPAAPSSPAPTSDHEHLWSAQLHLQGGMGSWSTMCLDAVIGASMPSLGCILEESSGDVREVGRQLS